MSYARSKKTIRVASDANFNSIVDALVADELDIAVTGWGGYTFSAATGGTTLKIPLTTVYDFYIENQDTTNYITVTLTRLSTGSTTALKVRPGRSLSLEDIDPTANVTVTANTAACVCNWFAAGLK